MLKHKEQEIKLAPFAEVIADIRAGKMVIMLDAVDRENEGDLVLATEMLTTTALSFMMRYGRGLICTSISREHAERLNLPLQTLNNNSPFNTPFTVSVDAKTVLPQGVTAAARVTTMKALISPASNAYDFVSPGHVFPLIVNDAGVLGRQGQTEGSADLARIAGLEASGVICEILSRDGSMARGAELVKFGLEHGLKITSVDEVIRYRLSKEVVVRETARRRLNTDVGFFDVRVFNDDAENKEHLALVLGEPWNAVNPLVRIHSECLTGDVFGSRRCDCGLQLHKALQEIKSENCGVLLYMRQEGRGIGLGNKLRAYSLQDTGVDTVDANLHLGFGADQRNYAAAAKILEALNVQRVRLLTNNPRKEKGLVENGIEVSGRVPLVCPSDQYNARYLETKRIKLGHIF